LLVVGSSLPARDLRHAAPREGVTVLANRGAAGIDGTVSTAIGAALAWQAGGGGPAAALVGDLTFLHDSNGLLLGPDEVRPQLAIVVVNNDGGGIFSLLEQGAPEHAGAFERIFGTPTGADLAALCGASQTPYTRVSTLQELAAAVTDPREDLQVIEARVPRPVR
jgi:2-succinyl-5-enolpyruvyl-6-hydroxy-3-cyclohexene-1-carboxylate synthase